MRQFIYDLVCVIVISLLLLMIYLCVRMVGEMSVLHHNTDKIIGVLDNWELDE